MIGFCISSFHLKATRKSLRRDPQHTYLPESRCPTTNHTLKGTIQFLPASTMKPIKMETRYYFLKDIRGEKKNYTCEKDLYVQLIVRDPYRRRPNRVPKKVVFKDSLMPQIAVGFPQFRLVAWLDKTLVWCWIVKQILRSLPLWTQRSHDKILGPLKRILISPQCNVVLPTIWLFKFNTSYPKMKRLVILLPLKLFNLDHVKESFTFRHQWWSSFQRYPVYL